MKIKEHLSVYLESGYLFDDMSGKLKWFEIDKILISFTYGVVRYVGTWGGCRAEKTLDGKLFYSSEECFKKGNSIPKTKLSIYDVFESLYGFVLIGDVWKYENERAVKCELECFDVEIDNKGKIYCKETYYRTCEDVYKFNDLTVVDKNGDMRLVKSSKSKLMLTNDQLDVVERMKGIIDEAKRLWGLIKVFHDGGQFKRDLVLDVNGHRWAFNRYENDILTAGCHRIAYSEMEGVARQLGWD